MGPSTLSSDWLYGHKSLPCFTLPAVLWHVKIIAPNYHRSNISFLIASVFTSVLSVRAISIVAISVFLVIELVLSYLL